MKEWLTARELASAALPDLPETESAIIRRAEREGWNGTRFARERTGKGGGTEYHVSLLPTLAQVTHSQRHMMVTTAIGLPAKTSAVEPRSARASEEQAARRAVVAAFKRFSAGLSLGYASRVQVFSDQYNVGTIPVAEFVRELIPTVSKRSLARWQSAVRDDKPIGADRAQARRGTGVLDTANDGRVRTFILGLIAHRPALTAEDVRTQCRAEFGDMISAVLKGVKTYLELPPVRTFQHTLKRLKATHKVELIKLTNPDQYRSTLALSGVGTLRHVTEPNQMWQIDASPVDALCMDGRHSIYVCIDVATRRIVLLLSRTPRASAVALLIRKAILEWGVPATIKTDNGSDFVARDTQLLFASLGIDPDTSEAYSPEQKGHVERVIRTFQHGVGPKLPGYIGHSVSERKAIESRKSFAQRLGEDETETFGVTLSGAELQQVIDDWTRLVYQHRPHAGLKRATPYQTALAATAPVRTVDVRALDLLLMPVAGSDGRRHVTKFGVRIDHRHYLTPTILPGTAVFVRQDPNDAGRAYVFEPDGASFLTEAICPELSGLHPQTLVTAAKEISRELMDERTRAIKAEMKRIAKGPSLISKALEVARRDEPNVIALPKRTEEHSTPQIEAAIAAMGERLNPSRPLTAREEAERQRMLGELSREDEARLGENTEAIVQQRLDAFEEARTAHLSDNVVALPETPRERYRRALTFQHRLQIGELAAADALWLGRYQASAEFKAERGMHEDFGEAYLS